MSKSELEVAYRDLLRWYPKGWRASFEDAAIGTLLDAAEDNGRKAPSREEQWSLRWGGLRRRAGVWGRWIPRSARDRASAISLGFGASMGLTGILFNIVVPLHVVAVVEKVGGLRSLPHFFGPFGSDGVVLYAIWVLAGLLALSGLKRSARIAVATTVPVGLTIGILNEQLQQLLPASLTTLMWFEILALVVLVGTPGRGRAGRITLPASFLVSTILTVWTSTTSFAAAFYSYGYTSDGFTQIEENWLAYVAPIALLTAAVLAQTRLRVWAGAILISLVPVVVTDAFAGLNEPDVVNSAFFISIVGLVCVFGWIVLRILGFHIQVARVPLRPR